MSRADLEFQLKDGLCANGHGHQWSYVWAHHPTRRHRRIKQYLGRKQLPTAQEELLDRIAEQLDKKQRPHIGGIAVMRLCEDVSHGKIPRLE